MARKNKQRTNAEAKKPQVTGDTPTDDAIAGLAWPASFAAPQRTVLLLVFIFLWGVLMFLCGYFNLLLPVKYFLAGMLGLENPTQLGPSAVSLDLAWLIFAGGALVASTLIHPAVGLGVLLLLRPWLDGYTFPTDNVYFLWAAMFILLCWGLRAMSSGVRIRGGVPLGLLAGFLFVVVLNLTTTINYEESYRGLLLWSTYGAVFFLAINAVRDRGSINTLTGFLILVMAAQAIFAILQFEFLLPYMRKLLTGNAELRQQFFGVAEWTPELARRFNVNRAFGTVLFPNALAALIILVLPPAAAGAVVGWRQLKRGAGEAGASSAHQSEAQRRYHSFIGACVIWFFGTIVLFLMMQFPILYNTGGDAWYKDTYATFVVALVATLIPAGVFFRAGVRRGPAYAVRGLFVFACAATTLILLRTLWITYSRGGMLALAAAVAFAFTLWFGRQGIESALGRMFQRRTAAVAVVLAAACLLGLLYGSHAVAQAPVPAPQTAAGNPTVSEEGIDLGIGDLANPETLSLRFTYWRVGLRIFADHWMSGVGLGNFKWAYPRYQYVGAGDVREAHNSFLQAFVETGIVGGILLTAFWAWFFLYGAWRVVQERNAHERMLLLGLYTGVLAFCVHAVIDINFSHASLMTFTFIAAGLFYSRARLNRTNESPVTAHLVVLVIAVAAAATVAGLSTRLYARDLALSRMQMINVNGNDVLRSRYATAQHFLQAAPQTIMAGNRAQAISLDAVRLLLDDPAKLRDYGLFYAPIPNDPTRLQKVKADEPVPAQGSFLVKKWKYPLALIFDGGEAWVRQLQRIDAIFPRSPELALEISAWYQLFCARNYTSLWMNDENTRARMLKSMMDWSREALARNPYSADLMTNLAHAHLAYAYFSTDAAQREHFASAMDYFEAAHAAAPAQVSYLTALAHYSEVLARSYEQAGDAVLTAEYQAIADASRADRDAMIARLRALARGEG